MALAKGDLDQAKFLIFMDTVFFLIPTLSSLAGWKKGVAKAARDMGTLPRLIGEALATRGVSGIREALADVPKTARKHQGGADLPERDLRHGRRLASAGRPGHGRRA